MKTFGKKNFVTIISILAILTLALSACDSPASTPVVDTPEAAVMTADCPVGNWQMTDISSYFESVAASITNMAPDYTLTDLGATGTVQFSFNPDGTSSVSADNFQQSFTMKVDAGGNPMEIPVVLTINGTSTATYLVENDQITFIDQQAGDMVITMDAFGSSTEIGDGLLGQPGSVKLYQFSCDTATTMSLKVIAVSSMDLAPLQLTRLP
jgi:hypothetical protein